ncbi:MAG: limonene-1,2-epoxide hydrolase [Gammaproteobacteria bacterium]|nr:limonene-1,2-epoxide hydrolase [Gammaproteobacteria bacterium]
MNAEQAVNNFIADVDRKDMDAAMAWVAEDCYDDNVPLGNRRGRAKMREFLWPFFTSAGPVKFEIVRQTAAGNIVMNERIDRFTMKGREIALPVSGVCEVNNDQLTFWRDYFANGMFVQQLNGG